MPDESQNRGLSRALAALLMTHFPELGTDEPMGGADTVEGLVNLDAGLRSGGGENFAHPVQVATDAYLADGGTASGLVEMLAEVAAYAGPQTRPDEGEQAGEYDELAEELEAVA